MTPTVEEERQLELRGRGLKTTAPNWRTSGPVIALVFFVLTCGAVAATWGLIFMILESGKTTSRLIAIAAVALAEYLIRRERFFGMGVESALWISGAFCIIFGLPGEGSPAAVLLFAIASAAAGLRVRNPFFGALSLSFAVAYLNMENMKAIASAVGVAVSVVALFALRREWKRPSTEMLWVVLLVVAPIVGVVASLDTLHVAWAPVFAVLAGVSLAAGLTMRSHAPLIAAFVNLAICVTILAAHDLLPFAEEWRLMIGGAVVLAASAIVSRALRDRARGLVVSAEALTKYDEELQMFGTVALQPRVEVTAAPEGSGGQFGGAGSTGKF